MLINTISGVLIRAISGVLIRTISSYDEEEVANCSIKGIIVFSDDFQDDLTFAIIVHYILCSAKLKILFYLTIMYSGYKYDIKSLLTTFCVYFMLVTTINNIM